MPPDEKFYCLKDRGLHSIRVAGKLDVIRRREVVGKVYPTGYCLDCWRRLSAVETDEVLAVHEMKFDKDFRTMLERPTA